VGVFLPVKGDKTCLVVLKVILIVEIRIIYFLYPSWVFSKCNYVAHDTVKSVHYLSHLYINVLVKIVSMKVISFKL
jgi:hypothetical protein